MFEMFSNFYTLKLQNNCGEIKKKVNSHFEGGNEKGELCEPTGSKKTPKILLFKQNRHGFYYC